MPMPTIDGFLACADRLGIVGGVGPRLDREYFRIAFRPLGHGVDMEFAEALPEGDMLVASQHLVAQHENLMLQKQVMQSFKLPFVQSSQIQATDLGTDMAA